MKEFHMRMQKKIQMHEEMEITPSTPSFVEEVSIMESMGTMSMH